MQKHYLQDCNSQTYKISIYYIWRLKYYKGSTHRSAYIWLKWQSTMLHNPEKSAKSLWNYFSQKKKTEKKYNAPNSEIKDFWNLIKRTVLI